MTFKVCFWRSAENGGYDHSEVVTRRLGWKVGDRHFEAIHGVSRILTLLVDKFVAALEHASVEPLLTLQSLLTTYVQMAANDRLEIDPLLGDLSDEDYIEVDADDDDDDDDREIELVSFRASVMYIGWFVLRLTATVFDRPVFCSEARRCLLFAEQVRNACDLYLLYAHPITVWSRRLDGPRLEQLKQQKTQQIVARIRQTRGAYVRAWDIAVRNV